MHRSVFHRHNTFAFQTDLAAGLCARTDLAYRIPFSVGTTASPPKTAVVNGIEMFVYTSIPFRSNPALPPTFTFSNRSPASPPLNPGFPLPTGIDSSRNCHFQRLNLTFFVFQMNHFLTTKCRIIKTYGYIRMDVAAFSRSQLPTSEAICTKTIAVVLVETAVSITVETVASVSAG